MSEYVNLSDLLSDPVWKCTFPLHDKHGQGYLDGLDDVEEVINHLPTINIVRCSECEHFELAVQQEGKPEPDFGFCEEPKSRKGMAGVRVTKNHFCSFGKEKEKSE